MSKVKQMAWDNAEKEVDKITNDYLDGNIDLNTAENKISEVDNVELVVDKNNIESLKSNVKVEVFLHLNFENPFYLLAAETFENL